MFKNARLYRLDQAHRFTNELDDKLAERPFRTCGPLEIATLGWVPPLGEHGRQLVHEVNGCTLVCARRQERLLPSAVVAEVLDERVGEIEDREARTVGRNERKTLRDEVLLELLPKAFTRSRQIQAYIDGQSNWVIVDAASEKQAEDILGLLRECIGSFPVRPAKPGELPEVVMTRWVTTDSAPADLVLMDECELKDARDERATVRCKGQDLGGEEISIHLKAGKQVTKLALDWRERLSFVLQPDLSLKRLQFADALLDEASEHDEDPAARFDAEFAIMTHELRELVAQMENWFALDTNPKEA